MTYREYFAEHSDENFSWCKCYADREEENFLVMHDGLADSIKTPEYESHRYGGRDFEEDLEALARKVEPYYDGHRGYSDVEIALQRMHEIGCAHCPFRDECQAMDEDMDDRDLW